MDAYVVQNAGRQPGTGHFRVWPVASPRECGSPTRRPSPVTAYDEAGAVAGQVRDVTYLWTGPRAED
ncbi:hypothetical protein ACQEUU_03480 [Nonomuraea sp. CA-218870]|uniref:hypothetical protein n=1 Tax=Nonomuraea sp. CA-218870 TaxID=3239998 RepID=UPI003D944F70